MKTAVYARYSSGLQRPTSIDDQISLCQDAAARFGCDIDPDHICTDREISGSEEHREGYQRLMAAARRQEIEAIIVEGQDRLWRNQAEMHSALRRLTFWGIKVFSVETGGDLTDKTGKLIASVMGWRDEAYLDSLRDKTRRGLAGQARRGFSAGGKTYGYRTEPVIDPAQRDPHGNPKVLGYRRIIVPEEAAVVQQIFKWYADGWSHKKIGLKLNQEKIPAPRSKHGWTWTAIYGSPALETGILNNSLYIGQVIWNKFRWEKNPETGKRVPRVRPREEWIIQTDESLRIIPQDLWDRVKQRQRTVAKRTPIKSGRPPKYLFSGLMVCGVCGAKFVMRDKGLYICSFHHNRGPEICSNAMTVKRETAERVLLNAVRQLFAPESVAYLSKQVNEALKDEIRRRQVPQDDRKQLEADLQEALAELDNIRTASKRGLTGNLTQEMISQAEAKVRGLKDRLATPRQADLKVLAVLPEVIQRRLKTLERVLDKDVNEARTILRSLLGEITLKPTQDGLKARLQGNIRGLIAFDDQTPVFLSMVAGGGFEPPTFGL